MKYSISEQFKNISIWIIFSIAILRGLEFLQINSYVYHLLFPGLVFYMYLIYSWLKTNRFLSYWNFLLSILIISFVFHSISLLDLKYIRLEYRVDDLLRTLVLLFASICVASVLYLISYLIHRISRG